MVPLIGGGGTWQDEPGVLVENSGANNVPPYCGVRVEGFLYTQYATGEEELYDMKADPGQLTNVVGDSGYASELDQLRTLDESLCKPTPPNFNWSH